MQNLEKMCVHHIKAMRNIVYTEQQEKCRNCSGQDEYCNKYKPYDSGSGILVRKGKVAYVGGVR